MFGNIAQSWTNGLDRKSAMDLMAFHRLSLSGKKSQNTSLKCIRNWINRCCLVAANGKVIDHPAEMYEDENLLLPSYKDYDRELTLASFPHLSTSAEEDVTAPGDAKSWESQMNALVSKAFDELMQAELSVFITYTKALYAMGEHYPTKRVRAWWQSAYVATIKKAGVSEPTPFTTRD